MQSPSLPTESFWAFDLHCSEVFRTKNSALFHIGQKRTKLDALRSRWFYLRKSQAPALLSTLCKRGWWGSGPDLCQLHVGLAFSSCQTSDFRLHIFSCTNFGLPLPFIYWESLNFISPIIKRAFAVDMWQFYLWSYFKTSVDSLLPFLLLRSLLLASFIYMLTRYYIVFLFLVSITLQSEYPKYTTLLAKILEGLLSRNNVEDKIHHYTEVNIALNCTPQLALSWAMWLVSQYKSI